MVYMDDIIIYIKIAEEHKKDVREILKTLEKEGLKLNQDKSVYGRMKISILGHVVGPEGVKIDPSRIESIKKMKIPSSKKELE